MSGKCQCLTHSGTPCKRPAERGSNRCWQHRSKCDPIEQPYIPTSALKPSTGTKFSMLPGDINRKIAMNLTVKQILDRCTIDKKFQSEVCNNKKFWEDLAQQRLDYPQDYARARDINTLKKEIHDFETPYSLQEGLDFLTKINWAFGNPDIRLTDTELPASDPSSRVRLQRKIDFKKPWYFELPGSSELTLRVEMQKMPALASAQDIIDVTNKNFDKLSGQLNMPIETVYEETIGTYLTFRGLTSDHPGEYYLKLGFAAS